MKISHIRISNILGIDDLEFSPGGALTEISGPNGTGKTSILEAIKAVTGGGQDATLLRKGADKGEVVLVLDDGTELHQRVTATGSKRDVVQGGEKLTKPADFIKALTDNLSVNPVDFLTAPKRDRVNALLEAMPIQIDVAKLTEISGVPVNPGSSVHGLQIIDLVRQQVYEDRTGTNRAVKEKDATINQLRLAMPEVPGGVEGNEGELLETLEQARAARDAETKRIDDKLTGLRQESQARVDVIRESAQKRIDEIKAEAQSAIDTEKAALTDTEAKAGRVRQKALDTFVELSGPIDSTLSAIRTNRNAFAKREQTLLTIAKMEEDLAGLVADAARQTEAIDAIDGYKSDLLAALPIPGLEVKDGEVFRDGIAFDRLNTAQQVSIAIDIAKLRAGELGIVCIDRFECMAPDAFEEFKQRAETSGLQLFVTRVTGEEFSVRTQ